MNLWNSKEKSVFVQRGTLLLRGVRPFLFLFSIIDENLDQCFFQTGVCISSGLHNALPSGTLLSFNSDDEDSDSSTEDK